MSNDARPGDAVVLIGASNLTMGFPTVVNIARSTLNVPVNFFACLGHGRSYGLWSRVMGRSLPGIVESGLWPALRSWASSSQADATKRRCFALITDIGNDIMYGVPPKVIVQWVEHCVDQLELHNARIVINAPPIESIRNIRRWQYAVVRAMLFPTRRISYPEAIDRASELHDRVVELASSRSLALVDCERDWYGFDPIHIRRSCWLSAWQKNLHALMTPEESVSLQPLTVGQRIHLATRTPHEWRLLGLKLGRTQPSGTFADGSTLSLF